MLFVLQEGLRGGLKKIKPQNGTSLLLSEIFEAVCCVALFQTDVTVGNLQGEIVT